MKTIYVAGHKSPDLDSVIGSMAYAYLKQQLDSENQYQPIVPGELNNETDYIITTYNLERPPLKESIANESVILVDHNESYQAIDGISDAMILEVIDHHKLSFDYHTPIKIIIEPIGSSCSVIYKLFRAERITIPQNLAAAMLAAVLTDTVITKSPTTTPEDVEIIRELSSIAAIPDWQEFGMTIFKVRSSVADKSSAEIVTSDFKDFDIAGNKIGIGQVETVDVTEFDTKLAELITALDTKRNAEGYHTVMLFITDIIAEESIFLISSDAAPEIAQAFGQSLDQHMFTAPVMSRKKQVIPTLTQYFSA
jgi:manganese-dependent inorganic pyrophosphatase